MPAAIETENLTKDYLAGFWRPRRYRALNALSLQVDSGEVFGFLGPNGAGKSTTLKLLMQLIYPTSGAARILGQPVGGVAIRHRIGYLAENPYFYDYLTAEEVLTYFARLFGSSSADARARTTKVLDVVGIAGERRMRLRNFSKGMLQRVGLAQAIINDPELIFLDEPMSGLDPLGRRDVRDLILRLRAEGRTVFFSSHILSDAETLCSRVAIMAQGRLVATGRVTELVAFAPKGWELIVSGVDEALRAYLAAAARTVRQLSPDRYAAELAAGTNREQLLIELAARGGRVESLNPVRDTLEDYFVETVKSAELRQVAG